jgi:hypothetical protein
MPLLCTKTPGNNKGLAMWSLGRLAGAGGAIPASSGGGVGWGERGEGLGFTRDLFGPELGVEEWPTAVFADVRRRPPQGARLR